VRKVVKYQSPWEDDSECPPELLETLLTMQVDDGYLEFPAKWEICVRCHGDGVKDCFEGGFSRNDEFVDADFLEDYAKGRYDKECPYCHGAGKVLVPDEDRMPTHMKAIFLEVEADRVLEAEMDRADARTKFYECGGY